MIKNERQYRITRAQLERFYALLQEIRARSSVEGDDLRAQFERAAVEAQVSELTSELAEYEGLQAGTVQVGALNSLDQLPDLLIRQRIAAGLTQQALAAKLGLKEQQVQRYEAERWSTASLSRLTEVAHALDLGVRIPASSDDGGTVSTLVKSMRDAGVEPDFIRRRIMPRESAKTDGTYLLDVAARIGRVFGWSPTTLIEGGPPMTTASHQLSMAYKMPAGAATPRVQAYTVYTHYLALLAMDAASHIEPRPIPQAAEKVRQTLLDQGGSIDFGSALRFAWDSGIPVLPLSDPGGFHAIIWRTAGRNVIVLKQQHRTASRWLFDLLHELGHASEAPNDSERVVVEGETPENGDSEDFANQFAGHILLAGRAEELAQECVETARGRVQTLKRVVPEVAARHGVSSADLANYMAYRLSLQGINWWGTAANLQSNDGDPWATARDEFLRRADLSKLAAVDLALMTQALAD